MSGPPNAERRPSGDRDGEQSSDYIGGQANGSTVGQPGPYVEGDQSEPTSTPRLRVRRRTVRRHAQASCRGCGWRTRGGWALARAAAHGLDCGPVVGVYEVRYEYGVGASDPEPESEAEVDHRDGPERASLGLSTGLSRSGDRGTPADPDETWEAPDDTWCADVADWDWDD